MNAGALPETSAKAAAIGSKYYATGEPCKNGHVSGRYTVSGKCVDCGRERKKRYRETDKARETEKRWVENNPESIRGKSKRWYHAHVEKASEMNRAYKKADPDANRARENRRRALKLNAEGFFTKQDILELQMRQGSICAAPGCRCREKLTIDHIVPLAKGGSNWPHNLQLLCPSCNSRKHTRDNDEFMAEARSKAAAAE